VLAGAFTQQQQAAAQQQQRYGPGAARHPHLPKGKLPAAAAPKKPKRGCWCVFG
jgi:hypothetical protein